MKLFSCFYLLPQSLNDGCLEILIVNSVVLAQLLGIHSLDQPVQLWEPLFGDHAILSQPSIYLG